MGQPVMEKGAVCVSASRTAQLFVRGMHLFRHPQELEAVFSARELATKNRPSRAFYQALRIVWTTHRAGTDNMLRFQAAALTYFTLLSIVPLLAVVFSLFKAFGGLNRMQGQMQDVILDYVAAGNKAQVSEYFDKFITNVHASTIGVVGVGSLLVVGILLLGNVEQTFNRIFQVSRPRSIFQKLPIYWSMITLGPIFLGISLTLSATLWNSAVVTWLMEAMPQGRHFLKLVPVVATWFGFTFLFLIMPATKVTLKAALIAGISSGTLFECLKWLYGLIATRFFSYNAIYGSLGAIPILIIWFDWAWRVVLLGGQLCYVVQHAQAAEPVEKQRNVNQNARERFAWRAMVEIARAFYAGEPPLTVHDLSGRVGSGDVLMFALLATLTHAGLLRAVDNGSAEPGYVPARDLEKITLESVLQILRHEGGDDKDSPAPAFLAVDQWLSYSERTGLGVARRIPLSEVVRQNPLPSPQPANSPASG